MIQLLKNRLEKNKETWYVLSVTFGREHDVRHQIMKMQKDIDLLDIIVPEQIKDTDCDVYKYFLGYAFIKLFLNMEKYASILEIDSVYRFLGCLASINRNHVYVPYHISDKEMKGVKEYLTGKKTLNSKNEIKINDKVIVIKGDLATIKGKVIEINRKEVKLLPDVFFQNIIVVPTTHVAHYK